MAAPVAIPICAENPGGEPARDGGTFDGQVLVQLHSATQGASIAYALESGDTPSWRLYAEPFRLEPGTTVVRARAIRIGYLESNEAQVAFTIGPGPGPKGAS